MLNKPNLRVVIVILVLIGTVVINYFINSWQFEKKYAWLDLNKVYQEFKMKKDLEKQINVVEGERKRIMDSLELDLKIRANAFESLTDKQKDVAAQQFQQKKKEYIAKKQQFDEDNEQMTVSYNQQVLKQINQYVKDYSIEKNYYMVLGAEGSGALMYARDNIDITEDILTFINNKYKGSAE